MELKKYFTAKRVLFFAIFVALTVIADKINFSPLVGAKNQFFTLFQFFGPIAGAFLGPIVGAASVLVAELVSFVSLGKAFNVLNVARLTPMLFAAYYFATYSKKRDWRVAVPLATSDSGDTVFLSKKMDLGVVVPVIAIIAFVVNPVGREVWYFSLFWTIPLIAKLLPENLFLRSLGSTFTAHAVGGAIWAWTVPMTAAAWNALIPVVAYERLVFTIGIALSFYAFNTVLNYAVDKDASLGKVLKIDARYVLGGRRH